MRKKWEYKAILLSLSSSEAGNEQKLNTLGDEGWELVTVAVEAGMAVGTAFLKREKA